MIRKGFTLIELLIVMAVVAILVAIIIPSYRGMQDEAWQVKAEKELQTLQVAIESYFRHNGYYPASLDDLIDNLADAPGIITKELKDPWTTNGLGTPKISYGYEVDNSAYNKGYYLVYSMSKDAQDDTAGAVVNKTSSRIKLVLPGTTDDIVFTNLLVEKQ